MRLSAIAFTFVLSTTILWSGSVRAQLLQAVQIYTDDQLLSLIKKNIHLSRVVLDDCQLVQDIEVRAQKSKKPGFQFLWGDMLAYGVCVDKNVKLGLYFMHQAADQGLPEGLEQLGRYYDLGKFVQKDTDKAQVYLREAAAMGNIRAQLRLVDIFKKGLGSPLDYPELYSQLNQTITGDKKTHQKIATAMAFLESKMPPQVIARAKKS